eukprot:TRINITY_DN74220_c0_g1_i1.p1 TRINITY_DN74220_c0_g1~~TRINITY_DN74220_c0_g1_i1.p1  ORF type:complete len:381 (-),score=35.62 TRINITY_DN74220_c0_g1_i1:42-1184(-)
MHRGLSTIEPCRLGHERPYPAQGRRWRRREQKEASGNHVAIPDDAPSVRESKAQALQPNAQNDNSSFGRAIWLLESRCVEMSLPTGAVRCTTLPMDLKSGSRAVWNTATPDELFVLENGSSSVLRVRLGDNCFVQHLTQGREASRFRSSLGSRFVMCGSNTCKLLVTGTPGNGAHTPWVFDVEARQWERLQDAHYPILSSAVAAKADQVTIVGGWSKDQGCHGNVQVLNLVKPQSWTTLTKHPVPWRRPGAMCYLAGQLLLALGWMECEGKIGAPGFHLLRRNGASQRAQTSSSKLCSIQSGTPVIEVGQMPFADSFEHTGELHSVGNEQVVCIGRDHIQAYSMKRATWQTWPLPREIGNDGSSSWVKHCGSWALAWIAS